MLNASGPIFSRAAGNMVNKKIRVSHQSRMSTPPFRGKSVG
jgi:hypothetical protein